MFLIHTSFKKRKPKKPNAKQRQLKADWEDLLARHAPKKPIKQQKEETLSYSLSAPPGRETVQHPSLSSGFHDCSAKPANKYTGTKILGIGTLHKSNAVPVFSDEEAKDISTMRRN